MDFSSAAGSAFKRAGDFGFLAECHDPDSALALDLVARTRSSPSWLQSGHLIAFVPSLSLFIRRLQDAGYSPWMTLFVLACPLGAVVFLVLLTQPTVSGAPKFKDDTRIPTVTDSVRSPAWTANFSFERPPGVRQESPSAWRCPPRGPEHDVCSPPTKATWSIWRTVPNWLPSFRQALPPVHFHE